MFHPEDDQMRAAYYLTQSNLRHTLVETIRLLNITWTPQKLLVITYKNRALLVWAPARYTKIIKCTVAGDQKSMQLDLLVYHDSCWPEGVDHFLQDLIEDYINTDGANDFDSTLHTMDIVDMENLPEDLRHAIQNLDHGPRKQQFTVEYYGKLFPLITHEMQRVEKPNEDRA